MGFSYQARGLHVHDQKTLIASIVQSGADNHLPGAYILRDYVAAGGLLWYGPPEAALFHRSAAFVDRILRGSVAAELPIEDPTVFDLSINVNTLQTLGLTIPQSVMPLVTEWID
jgi:putative ABC transport system substrate-binding protein